MKNIYILLLFLSFYTVSFSQTKGKDTSTVTISTEEYNLLKNKNKTDLISKNKICTKEIDSLKLEIEDLGNKILKSDTLISLQKEITKKDKILKKNKKKSKDLAKTSGFNQIEESKKIDSILIANNIEKNKLLVTKKSLSKSIKSTIDTSLSANKIKNLKSEINSLNSSIASLEKSLSENPNQLKQCVKDTLALAKEITPIKKEIDNLSVFLLSDINEQVKKQLNIKYYNSVETDDLLEELNQKKISFHAYPDLVTKIASFEQQLTEFKKVAVLINEAKSILAIAYDKGKVTAVLAKLEKKKGNSDIQKHIELLQNYCKKTNLARTYIASTHRDFEEGYMKEGLNYLKTKSRLFNDYPYLKKEMMNLYRNVRYKTKIIRCN